ncbi:MAG: GNAT family N-acetyltransferase [Catalinimonas sp.]
MNHLHPFDATRPRPPHFLFPPLPPSERLRYDPLSAENAREVWRLFRDDTNPHVIPEYKEEADFMGYTHFHLNHVRLSPKRAGHDWLLRVGNACVGLLNLYGLSKERFGEAQLPPPACVGFSVGPTYRRRGFAREAVCRVVPYVFQHFDVPAVRAFTEPKNVASQKLLCDCGFRPLPDEEGSRYCYFEVLRDEG